MSTLLKDIYSHDFYNSFSDVAEKVLPAFNKKEFIKSIFTPDWKNKELKERVKHTAKVLHKFMPADFEQAAGYIQKITHIKLNEKNAGNTFALMFLPDYIENYGINHFSTSIKTMELVTQLISCEFAVRPFFIKHHDKMMRQTLLWSKHKNHHVRRLASEGCRPRLPWGMAVPAITKNPQQVLPVLENLKNDESEYVRRSVANNLNDIAKTHPAIVITVAKKWKGISRETDALIRHSCRTLLKKGDATILNYFGLHNDAKIQLRDFKIINPKIKVGDYLSFSFVVKNGTDKTKAIRLEYAIYFLRQNGAQSKKVFKISERNFKSSETAAINKKQSFKIITTRKYYAGKQKISVIINGHEKAAGDFLLSLS